MAIKIQRLPSVLGVTGLSYSSLNRRVAKGEFPKPISLGPGRAVGWIESEVQEWLAAQVEASRSEKSK
ncbi:MAG: AlpA family phage regulatory protein [Roseobacter sp.]|uniref:helix-turn-helix transcriptional regulator n=1 Tax=Marinobacter TaxID=2742 RepID=UPI0025887070|nr:AlpA family phage regulatory protein [Marinobacter salarius]WOI18718.1 AlpA family phage regulatory protein [Marinobacter salarius]